MRLLLTATAALLAFSTFASPAFAQNSLRTMTDMAVDMYVTCQAVARQQPSITTPEQACACLTGYLGGAMSDRDFDIASRLSRIGQMTENGATAQQIQAEVNDYLAQGYTEADGNRVGQLIQSHAQRGDAICKPFNGPRPTI